MTFAHRSHRMELFHKENRCPQLQSPAVRKACSAGVVQIIPFSGIPSSRRRSRNSSPVISGAYRSSSRCNWQCRSWRGLGYPEEFVERLCDCIRTHRFRKNDPPVSREAKILFDADKLDVTGALGIARMLQYRGEVEEPIYRILPDRSISDGMDDTEPSFFREYHFKLERLYDRFHSDRGAEPARERRKIAADFYEALWWEVTQSRSAGRKLLEERITAG